MMVLLFTKVTVLLLAAWGFWTLWGFPYTNGILGLLKDLQAPGASIPGPTRAPMKQHYTGIKVLDNQLTNLVGFFYTAIDGNRADVSLLGLYLGGQVVAAWVLMVTESLRAGNQGKWPITSMTVLGLLMQNVGFACIAPIWMAIHLWTSPTVSGEDVNDLIVNPLQLAVAPFSILIGYGVPSIIMSLAAPAVISFSQKQKWAGLQQGWPIWIAITQFLISTCIAHSNPTVFIMTEDGKKAKALKYLRRAYAFALLCSVAGHVTAWSLSLLAYIFPVLFSLRYMAMMQPSVVFRPVWPFPPRKAGTIADGAVWFLQWDILTGTAAVMIWAITLRVTAKRQQASFSQWVIGFIKVALIIVAVGPAGAAVIALWSRDELVFRRAAEEKPSKKKNH